MGLPPELLNRVMRFCDTKSLYQLRLVHRSLHPELDRVFSNLMNVNLQYCLKNTVSPVALKTYNPTKYLANLSVPIESSEYALKCIKNHEVNLESLKFLLHRHPNGDVPMSHGFCEFRGGFANVLEDKSIIVWTQNDNSYQAQIVKNIKHATIVHHQRCENIIAVMKNGFPSLESNPCSMNPEFSAYESRRTIKKVCNNRFSILAQFDDGTARFITKINNSLKNNPSIPKERRIKTIHATEKLNLFLLEFDNGDTLCWGEGNLKGTWLIPNKDESINGKKVGFVSSNDYSFTIVFDDLRTVLMYGVIIQNTGYYSQSVLHVNQDSDIKAVYTNRISNVILLQNGKILVDLYYVYGDTLPPLLKDPDCSVQQVCHTEDTFSILLNDGVVAVWGNTDLYQGRNHPEKPTKKLFSNSGSYVLLFEDNTIFCVGDAYKGGRLPSIIKDCPVQSLVPNEDGYIALLEDGRLCYWGRLAINGLIIDLPEQSVKCIFPCTFSFVIELNDGELIPFGIPGDEETTAYQFKKQFLPLPKDKKLAVIDRDRSNDKVTNKVSKKKKFSFYKFLFS